MSNRPTVTRSTRQSTWFRGSRSTPGHVGSFTVDTGAINNAVDAKEFPDLPVEREVVGFSVLRFDMAALPAHGRPKLIGTLGLPALDCRALRIDFASRRFDFPPAFQSLAAESGVAVVPLSYRRGGAAKVRLTVAGREVTAVLVTGINYDFSLAADEFDRLPQPPTTYDAVGVTGGGVRVGEEQTEVVPSLGFVAGPTYADVRVHRGGSTSLIGIGVLARSARVVIDLAAGRMSLWPAVAPARATTALTK